MRLKVVAIVPALNERETIGAVLAQTSMYVDEIIVVDDGSSDGTGEIAEEYAKVVVHDETKGYGRSIIDGFEQARFMEAGVVVTLDADGQHVSSDIPSLLRPITHGNADIVNGIRPYQARFMERVFRIYGRFYGIEDPLCGLRAYAMTLYEDIGFFENFNSVGTQILFVARKRGFNVDQMHINLRKRSDTPRFGKKVWANTKLFVALCKLIIRIR